MNKFIFSFFIITLFSNMLLANDSFVVVCGSSKRFESSEAISFASEELNKKINELNFSIKHMSAPSIDTIQVSENSGRKINTLANICVSITK